MKSSGVIFDIQRFAIHDGPGIRTTVFLKGCNCLCAWCHNPESRSIQGQIEFYPSRCIGCGTCFKVCPKQCHVLDKDVHRIYRAHCNGCGICAAECNAGALVLKGRTVTVDEIMKNVLADKAYYKESGGGATLSGGEPVLQNAFALEILSACKKEGLHTAIQTAGNYPIDMLQALLPHLDMIMYDVKGYSRQIYDNYIHGDKDLILNNLQKVSHDFGGTLAVRTPVVSPVNDTKEEIGLIVQMLSKLPKLNYYQLVPYHGLAKAKYDALELKFLKNLSTPSREKIDELEQYASQFVPVFNQDRGMLK